MKFFYMPNFQSYAFSRFAYVEYRRELSAWWHDQMETFSILLALIQYKDAILPVEDPSWR